MSECAKCSGLGFVLVNHSKTVCDGCGGRGVISLILGKPVSVQESKVAEEKTEILEKIEELEGKIDDLESEKDDLDDEICYFENQIAELRKKLAGA